MTRGVVVAVCHSDQKGTRKAPIPSGIFIEDCGMSGDAHAEKGIMRQVSLLAEGSIEKMKKLGIEVGPGDFAENLTVSGLELHRLPPGTRLRFGSEVLLEITQIGKACHKGCAIFEQVGTCIMPKEGVFARVIRGGVVNTGDTVEIARQV
ncbi:MAG: MOSC domain-containing protein [Syntrophales bacterium]|jgi:MOSC domain-containing protein YiiM|nr:MOSC domain-containing protein [Syntrophales bacterium]MCK9392525.1 MOSC domain-containing protein [Syntrophales bacterium]